MFAKKCKNVLIVFKYYYLIIYKAVLLSLLLLLCLVFCGNLYFSGFNE